MQDEQLLTDLITRCLKRQIIDASDLKGLREIGTNTSVGMPRAATALALLIQKVDMAPDISSECIDLLILRNMIKGSERFRDPLSAAIKKILQSSSGIESFVDLCSTVQNLDELKAICSYIANLSDTTALKIIERLFEKKIYGLIPLVFEVNSETQNPQLLFRVAQAFGALADTTKALETISKIALDHCSNVQRENIAMLRAGLHHRIGENQKSLEILEPISDHSCDANLHATVYGYLHYSNDWSQERITNAAKRWQESANMFSSFKASLATFSKHKPRIGFISHSFKMHPVGWMLAGLFTQLKRSDRYSYYCYDCSPTNDFVAKTLRQNNFTWRDCSNMKDGAIFDLICRDNLDLLIDLDGLSANNLFNVVCSRPARFTAKWVGGLIGSTLNPNIDYVLADPFHCPHINDRFYTENIIRFDCIYVSYTPPPYKIYRMQRPESKNGFITFGCFNNAAKLSDLCLKTWVSILNENGSNKILLKDKYLGDPYAQKSISNRWQKFGGNPKQLIFSGASRHEDHLLTLQTEVDICLDPIPYSGGLSTLEAIYLGIPVITKTGDLLCHRHSTAHLSAMDLSELISTTIDEYITKAIHLAEDKVQLDKYRKTLRDQMLKSPLLDHESFSKEFEEKVSLMIKQS